MRLLIRTDGDDAIGTGHVMRMLALAEVAQGLGHTVEFATAQLDDGLERRLKQRSFQIERASVDPGSDEDLHWLEAHVVARSPDWVVLDGYHFDTRFQHSIRETGCRILFLDDYQHCEQYSADLILNQSPSAVPELYPRRARSTRLLLGPEYALLREDFFEHGLVERKISERADHVLVLIGGADPVNATEWVLDALALIPDRNLRARVVLGPSNLRAEALQTRTDDPRIELLKTPADLPALMEECDLAVSAAGGTSYELCFMGVPTMLVVLAENQEGLANSLAESSACESLGWHRALTPTELAEAIDRLRSDADRRTRLRARAQNLVDGKGAARVLKAMVSMCGIELEPA
jgi:UDP-2,4-diacetamido-2,4,6-trideoxy-beta-L-altropyranose hydrolase